MKLQCEWDKFLEEACQPFRYQVLFSVAPRSSLSALPSNERDQQVAFHISLLRGSAVFQALFGCCCFTSEFIV